MTVLDPEELTQPSPPGGHVDERERRRRQLAEQLALDAREATKARARETGSRAARQSLEQRFPGVFPGRPLLWFGAMLLVVAYPGIYVIDLVTLFPVVEYFATRAFRTIPQIVPVAEFGLPKAIMAFELWICMERQAASDKKARGGGMGAYPLFFALSIIVATVTPAAVLASFLLGELPFGAGAAPLLLVCLVAMSVVGHWLLIYAGHSLIAGYTFLGVRFDHYRNGREAERAAAAADRIDSQAREHFDDFIQTIPPGEGVRPSELDKVTRDYLERLFGRALFQEKALADDEPSEDDDRSDPSGSPTSGGFNRPAPRDPPAAEELLSDPELEDEPSDEAAATLRRIRDLEAEMQPERPR